MKMKLKLLTAGVVAVTAAALTISGRAQAVVSGPTCNVPGDYVTIQAAVNDVGCTTIKVASGPYAENVTIGRSLTLKGAKAGVSVGSRTFPNANESTVTGTASAVFTVQAPDVKIDGFAITNPGQSTGILIKTAGNNAIIKNNIIDTIGGTSFGFNTQGVYLENGPDKVQVFKNRMNNIQSVPTSNGGVYIGDSTANDPSLDILISENKITNITSATRGAYGIHTNNGSSSAPTATGYTTAEILGNTIQNLTGGTGLVTCPPTTTNPTPTTCGWVHAIGLEDDTPNVVVKKNSISNLVSTTADKVAVWFEDNQFFFTGEVNRNSLAVGNTAAGIFVHPALTTLYTTLEVDGECNWWGSSSGPGSVASGSGSLVSTGVDYKPWLKSANLNKDCGDKNHHDSDHHHGDWGDEDNNWHEDNHND